MRKDHKGYTLERVLLGQLPHVNLISEIFLCFSFDVFYASQEGPLKRGQKLHNYYASVFASDSEKCSSRTKEEFQKALVLFFRGLRETSLTTFLKGNKGLWSPGVFMYLLLF